VTEEDEKLERAAYKLYAYEHEAPWRDTVAWWHGEIEYVREWYRREITRFVGWGDED
jgi:hypothetical protein